MRIADWTESAGRDPSDCIPVQGVEVNHIKELLNHEPSKKPANADAFVAVTTRSPWPVFLHFVHRRCGPGQMPIFATIEWKRVERRAS